MPIVPQNFSTIASMLMQFQGLEAQLAALGEQIQNATSAAGVTTFNSAPLPTGMALDANNNVSGFAFDPTAMQNAYYSVGTFLSWHTANKINLAAVNC
jgi:hypothetical protein